MKHFLFFIIITFLFFSCGETKQGDLLEIPVDIEQNNPLQLSEIAEEITAIELELTDESLLSPDYLTRITVTESEVIIAGLKIHVFNKDGKIIRSIASRGQGPGEYNIIINIAIDKKNKRLFIVSANPDKIICYDLEGNFLKEFRFNQSFLSVTSMDLNYINDELVLVGQKMDKNEEKGLYSPSLVIRLSDDFQIIDSYTIRNLYIGNESFATLYKHSDFILNGNSSVYLFYGDFYIKSDKSVEGTLCDTLYRFENDHLVPELKLRFSSKFIHLFNVYRSSRYVISFYANNQGWNNYYFCYDIKTGKGYNMKDGFMDDINGIDKRVSIRPFNHDTEMFYYLHTHMKPGDLEEPNPTLYIGKLKK